MTPSFIQQPVAKAAITAVAVGALLLISFFAFEPAVVQGQDSSTFTVSTEVTGEISFTTAASDITMLPTIAGLTGGAASGTTNFAITTNNPAGYNVNISFASSTALEFNDGPESIPNLENTSVTGVLEDFDFGTGLDPNEAAFAYSIDAADHNDVVAKFTGTTSGCNTGTETTADGCWFLQSNASTDEQIINTSEATTASGDTFDIYFKAVVEANPDPTLPLGTYTATATLTATENP